MFQWHNAGATPPLVARELGDPIFAHTTFTSPSREWIKRPPSPTMIVWKRGRVKDPFLEKDHFAMTAEFNISLPAGGFFSWRLVHKHNHPFNAIDTGQLKAGKSLRPAAWFPCNGNSDFYPVDLSV